MTQASFRLLALLLLPAISFWVNGQTLKIVPPTPNAMKMSEFHAQKPNMYTGTANVSIPLHTINFDGWDLPLSLSYNATGIRPNEEAGEVGLGWVLNATGTISRTIRGADDLYINNTGSNDGYVYNERPIATNLGNNYNLGWDRTVTGFYPPGSYYEFVATQHPDTQPDIFNYNFFGYSGSFTLSQKIVDGSIKVLKITQDACKISFNESVKTFTVITPQGYKGEFAVHEKSTTFSGSMLTDNRANCCGYNAPGHDIVAIKESGRLRTITSWYLSKITSPRGQQITFKYDLRSAVSDGINYNPPYSNGEIYSPFISYTRSFAELESINSLETCIQTVHEHIYLDSIVSPDLKIKFLMETREDLRKNYFFAPGDNGGNVAKVFHSSENLKRYNSINIRGKDPASTLNKIIILEQRYFNPHFDDRIANNQNETELLWLRSRLDKVIIDDQEYQFYYEKGTKGLPNKLTTGIDHFGFYNGQDQIVSLLPPTSSFGSCSLSNKNDVAEYTQLPGRMVDFSYGIAGLLSKVKYPTRGWTSFEYEPHTYLPDATLIFREAPGQKNAGGARIKTIREYDYTNDQVPVLTKSYRYTEEAENSPATPTTGRLMTPLYNRYVKDLHDSNQPPTYPITDCEFFFQTYSAIPGNNSAEGKVIGYSRVHEVVIGGAVSYKNTYDFENTTNNVNPPDAGWGNLYAFGKPNLNGQLIKSRNYNNQNQIVQHIANDDREHTLGDIPSITYVSAYTNNDKVNPYYIYYTYSPIKQVFNTPYKITTTVASSPSGLVADANGNIVTLGNSTQTVTDLVYNTASLDDNFLLKSQQTVNSKSELIVKEFRRATDYAAPSPTLAYMKGSNVNMVEPIIEEITKLNGTVMSASGNKYILENGRVNLKNTYAYNNALSFTGTTDGLTFGNNYEMKEDFTTYDATSGKLLQYTDRSGVINSFIWGYDNKLPIVSGVGLSYPQLNTAHVVALASGAPGSNAYEVAIRNHASTVGKQVSTYVHNPQVGVVKVTDPLGLKKSFQYDAYNRLQKVIDKDGYTTEQYQYHFRERKQTRILSLSSPKLVAGNLNFGTLTPDMFDIGSTMYERCSDKLRSNVLTISNDGEDDLTIYRMTLPNGFSTIWGGAHTPTVIPAGTSVNVIINFDGAIVQPTGVYAGTISIDSSDMTSGTSQVTVSANYTYRNNSLSFSPVTGTNPAVLDLGTVSGLVAGRYIEITNTGNAPFRFAGFPLGWDGTSDNYSSFTNPDFSVSYYFPPLYDGKGNRLYTPCIEVGETVRIPVTFNPTSGPNGIRSAKLSIITDINQAYWPRNLYKDAVTIQANLQRPISTISMSTNAIDFGSFTEAFKTTPVTISNTGSLGFTVSGISVADGSVASWFSLSPSTWTLDPGTTKEFTLTFQPALKDVTANTTITINNDAMYGDETFAVIGRRYSLRRMVLSTEPSNLLVFDNPNETKSVTITNASISNDNLSVADFSPLNTSLLGWAVTSFSPTVLVPGQSMTMQIMRTGASPADQIITIGSTKNDGVNTFTLKNSVTRLIGVTTSPTTALPAFTTPSISQNITLSNSGNGTLTVGGITSSNPMFTVSPTTLEVAPNSQQIVTVTFTPTAFNFSQQSTTLTFTSNATGGTNTIALTGQRTSLKTIQLSTNSLGFTSTGQQQTVIVSNAGNNYLNITGVSYPNTSNWSASIAAANLAPGQSTTMTVTRLPGTNPEILNIAVLSDKNGGNEVLQVSAVTRKINLSSITFPAFTGSSISQPMTITNSGNSQLNVSNITSSNSRFTISPTSLTVAPNNGQQIVTIVYTPTDFTLQSTTLTITSDATGGVNTVNSSAQRSQLAQLNPSSTMLSVKPWDQTPASILTNTGNVAVTINTAGTNSNPSRFAIAYQTYSSVTWVNAPFPVTLQPGQQLRVVASTTQSGDFSTANGTLTIATTNAGTFTLTLTRSSF